MRTALVHERIGAHTDTPDEEFAPTLTHRDVLEFATIEGARTCGSTTRSGSLKPGKQADIVLLKAKAINTAPMVDPRRRSSSSPTRRTSTRCSSPGAP